MYRWTWFIAVLLIVVGEPVEASQLMLKYGERHVDLAPYYFDFPYYIRGVSLEKRKIYYTKDDSTGGSYLYVQAWDPDSRLKIDVTQATRVTDIDIEKINFWDREYNEVLDGLVVIADEDKSERTNLWLFSESMPQPIKLTNADYIYAFTQSDDGRTIAYVSRYGTSDHSEGCLEVLKIDEHRQATTQKLLCDSEKKIRARLNWWADLRLDGQGIVFTALADGDRNKSELYRYSNGSGAVSLLFKGHGSSWLSVISDWDSERRFLFVRDQDLFLYDLANTSETHLRKFENSISSYGTLTVAKRQYVFIITKGVVKSKFELFHLQDGSLVRTAAFESQMNLSVVDVKEDRLVLFKQSANTLVDYEIVRADRAGAIARSPLVADLADVNDRLANCKVSRVTYSYIDDSRETSAEREVSAYLYEPRENVPPDDRLFIVEAFYGGKNRFSRGFHCLCKVGISILSPVVRGDNRFGALFEQSNDREKADAPIRDVLAGARFLQSKFGFADSRRIGTWGYSHGGWAAARSVSYPGAATFDFGFAMAGAGYFDFLQIADEEPEGQTNIRGWIEKEFGDMTSQRDHLARISPSRHVDRIKVPVFLYHGRNDERITVRHSVSFAEKLSKANVPHKFEIVEDQGHYISGAKNWHQIYSAMFDFLDGVNEGLKR